MGRFRIDFTVRELDVPADDARGISFGDEVSAEQIVDFFNRCRDAARTLFAPGPAPKSATATATPAQTTASRLSAHDKSSREAERQSMMRKYNITPFPGDDGSRGGDGPISTEAEAWYKAQIDRISGHSGRY